MRAVKRVEFNGGSQIEPPLKQSWSGLEKLRWHAAVVEFDTGISVRIEHDQVCRFGRWRDDPMHYVGVYERGTSMLGTYREAWAWLNGVAVAARIAPKGAPHV